MEYISYDDLSDFIIAHCNINNIEISNKKLQKLMYYCQAWHLALLGDKLIENDFEAWVHGAVLRPLYFNYSNFGYNRICMDNSKAIDIVQKFNNNTSMTIRDLIQKVFNKYINCDADELEEINHSEYPWIKARQGLKPYENSDKIISKELIQEYYALRALEEGMKKVKDNVFKFSSKGLKQAQEKINTKNTFKPNADNFDNYQTFILGAYNCNSELIKRAEYGKNL